MSIRSFSIYVGITALLFFAGWTGWHHTAYYPYANNQLKPHRWAGDVCLQRGYPAAACYFQWQTDKRVSTEDAVFDMCLEHGELRRIK